jgi:DNA polymerase elongation subunit (family B)
MDDISKLTKPRILLYDIETSPIVATTWTLFKPVLSHENIIDESRIISAAWKFYGDSEVQAISVSPKRPKNDKPVVETLHNVIKSSDVLVAHNGDKFDLRKFNARAIFHGLSPLPSIPTIDTLKVARKVFAFNSNRLDYLGQFLCGTGKIPTTYDLWLRVMAGDEGAMEEMIEYNKMDIIVLEKVYEKLRPYIRNHPNASLYADISCCPVCASQSLIKRGFKYQKTTKRQQLQCKECGAWCSGKFIGRSEVS